MSILDSIHEAEAEAEQIKSEAKVKAREIVSKAQTQARAAAEEKVSQARESYSKQLEEITEKVDEKYASYLKDKEKENQKLAQIAQKNVSQAADYILQKVINQ